MLLFVSGCTQKKEDSSIRVVFPKMSQGYRPLGVTSASAPWSSANYMNANMTTCYAIAVASPLALVAQKSCLDASGKVLFDYESLVGTFKSGQAATLTIPTGAKRFYIIGFASDSEDRCTTLPLISGLSQISAPRLLAIHEQVLASGNVSIDIKIQNDIAQAPILQQCDTPKLFDSKVSPALISIAELPAYDFGAVSNNNNLSKIMTVTNTGETPATNLTFSVPAAPFLFSGGAFPGTGGDCTTTLQPGYSCNIVLSFLPIVDGVFSSTITISYNNGLSTSVLSLGLSGMGSSIAATLAGLPINPSSSSTLNVQVQGTGIVSYKYKIDAQAGDCSVSSGYSGAFNVANAITDSVSAMADGMLKLCVIGFNGTLWQPYNLATSFSWVKDTMAPTNPTISINASALYTNSTNTTLLLSAIGASEMYVTNTPGCSTGGIFESYVPNKTWTLTQINSMAQVYVKFKDFAGNQTNCLSDSITHDNLVPNAPTTLTLGSVPPNQSQSPTLSFIQATDNGPSGIMKYQVQIKRTADNSIVASWADFTSGSSINGLSLINGTQYYFEVRAIDNAENSSTVVQSSAWTASVPVVAILSNLPEAMSVQANLSVAVGGIGVTQYKFKFGVLGSTDCTNSSGYSGTALPIANKIASSLTSYGPEQPMRLCVIGGDVSNAWQDYASATAFNWTQDKWTSVTFNQNYVEAVEGNGTSAQQFSFNITNPKPSAMTVTFKVEGTAVYGVDHNLSSGTFSIAANTTSATIPFSLIGNGTSDGNRRFKISLSGSDKKYLNFGDKPNQGLFYIRDDETDSNQFTKVSAGVSHSCGITTAGVLKCWGGNQFGQLGDGTTTTRTLPTIIDSGITYLSISAGEDHTCGFTSSGFLKCWGANNLGQLGDGTTTSKTTPTVIDSGVSYTSISAGRHTCGVTNSGLLKCWGPNSTGQLGDGTTTQRTMPTIIDSGITYSSISIYLLHSCGITSTGVLKCWGSNSSGQVGDGTTTTRTLPTLIDSGINYSKVAVGMYHTCGFTSTGLLKCWGSSNYGQVGDGSVGDRTTPTVIDSGINYSNIGVGNRHTCGVTTSGILKCWGSNESGQLGDGTITQRTLPTIIDSSINYSKVAVGMYHTCGLESSGIIKCWGSNDSGQLGDGTTSQRTIPITIDSGITYSSISIGKYHTCGVNTAGVIKCWGINYAGHLGDGTTNSRSMPQIIDTGTNYSSISAGTLHTCGVTTTGMLKCWGSNTYGQLGDSIVSQSTAPIIIDFTTMYSIVSAGDKHTCALTTLGSLKCWGNDSSGQLGDGTIVSKSIPTLIDPGINYSVVSSGEDHTCGVTTSGVLKCWGDNSSGELGDGTLTQSKVPKTIDSGMNYSSVTSGKTHTCGLTTSGLLKCWGSNVFGQLGNGTTTQSTSPIVIDSGTNYSSIRASDNHTCGITTSGALKCWGSNIFGQLGNGTTSPSTTPIVIDSGINYSSIRPGSDHTCGVTTSGILKCWGSNMYGQLGDGTNMTLPTPIVP